jgi:hypothetical protein
MQLSDFQINYVEYLYTDVIRCYKITIGVLTHYNNNYIQLTYRIKKIETMKNYLNKYLANFHFNTNFTLYILLFGFRIPGQRIILS